MTLADEGTPETQPGKQDEVTAIPTRHNPGSPLGNWRTERRKYAWIESFRISP